MKLYRLVIQTIASTTGTSHQPAPSSIAANTPAAPICTAKRGTAGRVMKSSTSEMAASTGTGHNQPGSGCPVMGSASAPPIRIASPPNRGIGRVCSERSLGWSTGSRWRARMSSSCSTMAVMAKAVSAGRTDSRDMRRGGK